MLIDERREVERAAEHYYHTPLQTGIDNRSKSFVIAACLPHVRGSAVLELGYVDGLWTDALLAAGHTVDIVEGATRHAEHAHARYAANPRVCIHHALFSEFLPERRYDTVVAGDMLRYLDDPQAFLQRARSWLEPGGALVATLPNSRSLHRRIGSLMDMEPVPGATNNRDREVGNRRGYDRYELRALLRSSGYVPRFVRGCFLKPLSSAQMTEWSDELLGAFAEIGEELQEYAWFLYALAEVAA
jgi:SAM-dependent methyltransferase